MATPLTFEYRVDGVLTAVSPGPVTIGIVRDSDGAGVLSPGTATTTPSIGISSYDPTALLLSTSLNYTTTWTYEDATGLHAVTDKIEAADTSRSLLAYRRAIQDELGRFDVLTTSAASESTSAASELICAALADTDGHSTTYGGHYALLTDGDLAGEERRISRQGFTASDGTLLTSRAYSGTPASGVIFELAAALPATRMDGVPGVNAAVNWALQRTWFRDRISFAPVADQRFYSLIPWLHWLDRDLRIGKVLDAAADATSAPTIHRGGAWVNYDAELPTLELAAPFSSTDTIFYLEVLRPGHTWIKQGGAWSEAHGGLAADTDQALVSPNLVVQMALVHCYRQLAKLAEPGEREQWRDAEKLQAARAVQLRNAMLQGFPDGATGKSGGRSTPYPSVVF